GSAAAEIELEPVSHRALFHAGHFGFLRMKADGLREPHPFTIASAPSVDGRISFVIRALGDYTTKLIAEVEPGMHADVYAPYGRFERKPECEREIWIGGGVGISPFIAWMRFAGPRAIMAFAAAPFATNCLPSDDLQAHRSGTKPSPSDLPDGVDTARTDEGSKMRHPGFFIAALATFALAAGCAE